MAPAFRSENVIALVGKTPLVLLSIVLVVAIGCGGSSNTGGGGATTPTVFVSANPSGITTAQSTTVFVNVTGSSGLGSGSVTLSSGSYNSGAQPLSGGAVYITVPAGALAIGIDTLTAAYTSTSSTYNNASGTALVVVTSAVITPAVTVSPNPLIITPSQSTTVTVTLSGGFGNPTPTGSVTLTSGTYSSGAQTLVSGSVQITVPASSLGAGSIALTAAYTPDANSSSAYTAAIGRGSVLVSSLITPTVTVSAYPSIILISQSATITVSVSGGSGNPTPTGTVTLTCGDGGAFNSGQRVLNVNGIVQVQFPGNLDCGAILTAAYTPDFDSSNIYNPTSGTGSVTVTNLLPPTVTVSANPSAITTAQSTTVTVTVSGPSGQPTPAGTVDLSGPGFNLGDITLSNGSAQFTVPAGKLALGTDTLNSVFSPAGSPPPQPVPYSSGAGSGTVTVTAAPGTLLNVLNLSGVSLAWNSSQEKLYVAVPSGAAVNPASITVVDPVAGSILNSVVPSAAPAGLAIAGDNSLLYAVIGSDSAIQRYALPALTPDIQWSLGSTPAGDLKVEPGAPHTVAVSMGSTGAGTVAVFDDAVERPNAATSIGGLGNSLQWKSDGSALYAAYAFLNDTGYELTTSDNALFVMPVTSNGVGAISSYSRVFRQEGAQLHLDPNSNNAYNDWGEVVNASNGVPIGNFRYPRPSGIFYPGPFSALDPALGFYYTLSQIQGPDGKLAAQIQVFNQTQFQLLQTMVIPDVLGTPENFIRWGQSGLAFVTTGSSGQLYLLDGIFVNPSGAQDTTVGNPINPVPIISAISPLTATVGGNAFSLAITGTNFIGQPTVYWNGTALTTALSSSTQLSATVPSSLLASATLAQITVKNGSSSSPASNALPFAVDPAPPNGIQFAVYGTGGSDLLWNANRGVLYVTMPGVEGAAGDAIGVVDPVAQTVSSSGFLGSDPYKASLSSDGQYLYVGLNGSNQIAQLTLPAFGVNAEWNMGEDNFDGPYYAVDLQAAPAAPQTTAVVLGYFDLSPPEAELVVYDGSTMRSSPLQVAAFPYSSLQWAGNDSTIYSVDNSIPQSFLVLGVSPSGATLNQHYNALLNSYSPTIHYDSGTGLVYTDSGQVIQPSSGTIAGSYSMAGIAVPDSTVNRVYILGQTVAQTGTSNYTIQSFNQTTFAAVGSITISNVVGAPTAFVRWGANGLAFTTLNGGSPRNFAGTGPGQLYVISGPFVTQ
jgi:hypothetical protein